MKFKNLTKFLLLKASTIYLLIFISSGYASPLTQETTTNNNSLNLSYEGIITKVPVIVDFKKMEPLNVFELIKSRYLTFYSNKNEKVKATYLQGAYAINYTQSW